MITGIKESKTLRKHMSREFKCKFDGTKCNSNQKWKNNKYKFECKNLLEHHVCTTNYIWNPAKRSSEMIIISQILLTIQWLSYRKLVQTKPIPTNFGV